MSYREGRDDLARSYPSDSSRRRGRDRSASRDRDHRGGGGPGGAVTVKKARQELFKSELGYTDEVNPFGDQTLTEKFVWKKKNEYLAAAGLYQKQGKEGNIAKFEAQIAEINRVKKRRDEREVEVQLLEDQRLQKKREEMMDQFGDWVAKEDEFHLEQSKIRSAIRIDQGRERPIDLVAKALMINDGEIFEDMTIMDRPPH